MICEYKAGHENGIHKCSHFHKCTQNCSNFGLRECNKLCKYEYGHEEQKHLCNSEIHLCDQKCQYAKDSSCNGLCKLIFGHTGRHICTKEKHKCLGKCSYNTKCRGCINNEMCKYNLPHEGNHDCGGRHLCREKCMINNCQQLCQNEYIPSKKCIHDCKSIHYCEEKCDFKQLNGDCNNSCTLIYGHEGPHKCNNTTHYCFKRCYYRFKGVRNCNRVCVLKLGHLGIHFCSNEHYCIHDCSKINCSNKCNLLFGHKQKEHDCQNYHECMKPCYLKDFTLKGKCNLKCSLELGHEGDCLCSNKKEEHLCAKKCLNCGKNCKLEAMHRIKCFCGECICRNKCKYRLTARKCKIHCKFSFGHDGEHICEEEKHLCNHECIYKTKSASGCDNYCCLEVEHEGNEHYCDKPKNNHLCNNKCEYYNISSKDSCNIYCSKSIDHKPPCICNIKKSEHKCKKKCKYFGFQGCEGFCSLNIEHEGECICLATKKGHKCGKECTYKNARYGCYKKCNLSLDHPEDVKCICSSSKEEHKCNGICQFEKDSRRGCKKYCKFSICEEHVCSCENPEEEHICQNYCSLKDLSLEGTCNEYCIKPVGHEGECKCSSNNHKCNGICCYKELSREGCDEICNKNSGHKGEHLCKNPVHIHKCKFDCYLKTESQYIKYHYCDKEASHKGKHICGLSRDEHLCNHECSYKSCNKICNKIALHKNGDHNCGTSHKCDKKCHLYKYCYNDCVLEYNHDKDGIPCICNIKENEHECNYKCSMPVCQNKCCLANNHEDRFHLCNDSHQCRGECEQEGVCEIILTKDNGEETLKNKCKIKIPKGLRAHEGKHNCMMEEEMKEKHLCGERCKQCHKCCKLPIKNHGTLHYIYNHGRVDDIYKIGNYDCVGYCKKEGIGHTHKLEEDKINDIKKNLDKGNIKKDENNIYECKCSFFWKEYLQFEFREPDWEQKFDSCPRECPMCLKENKKNYCLGKLWHKLDDCEQETKNIWISYYGHKFKCKHDQPNHTIFLIDTSYSMTSNDITLT